MAAEGLARECTLRRGAMHAMLGAARLRRTGSQPRALEWADTASDPAQGWPTTLSARSPCRVAAARLTRSGGAGAALESANNARQPGLPMLPIQLPAVSLAGILGADRRAVPRRDSSIRRTMCAGLG